MTGFIVNSWLVGPFTVACLWSLGIVDNRADAQALDVTRISFGPSLPGYVLAGERTRLNRVEDAASGGGKYDEYQPGWYAPGHAHILSVNCTAYQTETMAITSFGLHIQGSSGLVFAKTSFGKAYGDECRTSDGNRLLYFRQGRVVVTINFLTDPDQHVRRSLDPDWSLVDGLALGLEIAARLEQAAPKSARPRLTAVVGGKAVAISGGIEAGGDMFAPINALKSVGAKVSIDQQTGESTLEFGGKSLKIPLFSNVVHLDGKSKTITRPATLSRGDVYIPIKEVSALIGIDVRQTAR